MNGRPYSEHEEHVIRSGYAVDRPINEIAAELGRSRSEIARVASERLGLGDKSRGGRIAAALVGPEGCRLRGFAAMEALKRRGYELSGAVPRASWCEPAWYRKARAMRQAGEKIEYIALVLRRSRSCVSKVCRGVVVDRPHRSDSGSAARTLTHAPAFPSREGLHSIPLEQRPIP